MIVKMYIDLPNDYFIEPEHMYITTNPTTGKMNNHTRYLVEVDLPVHHFKPVADRKIEAVVIGKEEE